MRFASGLREHVVKLRVLEATQVQLQRFLHDHYIEVDPEPRAYQLP